RFQLAPGVVSADRMCWYWWRPGISRYPRPAWKAAPKVVIMVRIKEAATEFLATKRIAVTGVSGNPSGHASNIVYQRLRQRGYQVFAVNPNAEIVDGDRAYPDLKSIPGGVESVVIATRPETAE